MQNLTILLRAGNVADLIGLLADALAKIDTGNGSHMELVVSVDEANGLAVLSRGGNPPSVIGKIVL